MAAAAVTIVGVLGTFLGTSGFGRAIAEKCFGPTYWQLLAGDVIARAENNTVTFLDRARG